LVSFFVSLVSAPRGCVTVYLRVDHSSQCYKWWFEEKLTELEKKLVTLHDGLCRQKIRSHFESAVHLAVAVITPVALSRQVLLDSGSDYSQSPFMKSSNLAEHSSICDLCHERSCDRSRGLLLNVGGLLALHLGIY